MSATRWKLRAAVLFLIGAVALHQLRYALTGTRADAGAHAYLSWLEPALLGILVAALAELGQRAALLSRRLAPPPRAAIPSRGRLWGRMTFGLVALFALQETLEGLLAEHRGLDAVTGVFGHRAWIVLLLAPLLAAAIALLLGGAAAVETWAAGRVRSTARLHSSATFDLVFTALAPSTGGDLLARNLGRRAPPAARS